MILRLPLHASRSIALALAVACLSQCSAPVSVHPVKPTPPPGLAITNTTTDSLIDTARTAFLRIQQGESSSISAYNFAVARLVEEVKRSGADPWSSALGVSCSGGIQRLSAKPPAGIDPLHEMLIPADTLEFKGPESLDRSSVPGIGAPLVAVTSYARIGHEEIRKKIPLRNLTALLSFEGNTAILEFVDPYQVETVNIAGRNRKLAADYSAAVMLAMAKARVDKLGIVRLLRPSMYNDTVHLNFLQPYDPKRIPVLMVHGLDSTPATFARMYFKLLEDPVIREKYQFWVFSYPSGYPYPYSASLLRRELDHVANEFPNHKDMVIIGHSMGTLISRLMVTDADDRIWRGVFGKPVEQTPISGPSREYLENSLVFRARSKIDRAIFISGPHRGSDLALNLFGRTFAKLVRLPGTMADIRDVMIASTIDPAAMKMTQSPNSIDTLSPANYFVIEINKIQVDPKVPYHSIMGDRGKGDTPDSSDGVVPYWSSHLKGAASEKIVPSGHGAHVNPEGIEEVRRILLLNLKES